MREETKKGFAGFLCPRDPLDPHTETNYCLGECVEPCLPRPLLAMLAEARDVVEGVYSVTEILNPPQQVYLYRNNPIYIRPSERLWAVFGSAWHAAMERGMSLLGEDIRKDFEVEKECHFEIDFGYAKLRGTPDLYQKSTKTLTDFKTIKAYAVKKMKAGDWSGNNYLWQTNIYRAFRYPEAERILLECVVKDWSMEVQRRDNILEFETIKMPLLDLGKVEKFTQERLQEHVANQKDPSKIRPCTDEERWINTNPRSRNYGKAIRCMYYCPVASICPQLAEA